MRVAVWGVATVVALACGDASAEDAPAPVASDTATAATPTWQSELSLAPVETVDLPFDRSQLTLGLRGTGPSDLGGMSYRDGTLAAGGAITLYSRLRVHSGPTQALRVMAQFRVEGERVTSEMLGEDKQVTKGSLGLSAIYLSPARRLFALYVGASIAETRETLAEPDVMPAAIGLGTTKLGPGVTWLYGGGLGYAFGRPWVLPMGGLLWQASTSTTLTVLLPVVIDVRRKVSRKTTLNLVASVSGDRFNFTNDGQFSGAANNLQLRMGQGKLALGVGYRVSKSWNLRGELGVVGPRNLEIRDGDATVMKADGKGAGFLATSVTYAWGTAPL